MQKVITMQNRVEKNKINIAERAMSRSTRLNPDEPITDAPQLGTLSSGVLVVVTGQRERERFVDFVR